ncbi:MAG: dihydroorotate dehydrogenase electron transfer subunit [Candidatus Thorarchaeota archaeon]|nr:dihydroorotate dehydrogenase electron transfer subunit [Candidatus Thorarchaeota archaeon]
MTVNLGDLVQQIGSVEITRVVEENLLVRTLYFELQSPEIDIRPGQFLMVWIPGVDEIPMSVSSWNKPEAGITVLPVGEATKSMTRLKKGDSVGIRGPFGTSFQPSYRKQLVVGGGIGIAPLRFLVRTLVGRSSEVTLIAAARSASNLIFLDELKGISNQKFQLIISTDDGTAGFNGLATDVAKELLSEQQFGGICTCGPEPMMAKLFGLAQSTKIEFQASLERFMKCGCGLCGTCSLDPNGDLVCIDGPVFTGNQLAKIDEFGRYQRNAMGIKMKF